LSSTRDARKLARAAEAVRGDGARDVLTVPTDVSKPEEAERLIAQTVERFGRIGALINTAGLIVGGG
jgi:NAD(P)-dependent dehydrogenase (short-subunit alcohol dehydrogenase family)